MFHFGMSLSHVGGTLASRASVFNQEALLPLYIEYELADSRKGTLLHFSKTELNLYLSPHTSV